MWWKRLCLDAGWSVLQSSHMLADLRSVAGLAQMPFRRTLVLLLAWLAVVPAARAQGWSDDPEFEARLEALLRQMTLEEKLGKLSHIPAACRPGPAVAAAATRR